MVAACSSVNIQASFLAGFFFCLLILYSAFSTAKIQSETRTPSAKVVWSGTASETQITCLGAARPLILLRKALYKFIKSIKAAEDVMGPTLVQLPSSASLWHKALECEFISPAMGTQWQVWLFSSKVRMGMHHLIALKVTSCSSASGNTTNSRNTLQPRLF